MKRLNCWRKLHRLERSLWIVVIVCLFALFEMGIQIEYNNISTVTLGILHTLTVALFIISGVLLGVTIEKEQNIESEVFKNER